MDSLVQGDNCRAASGAAASSSKEHAHTAARVPAGRIPTTSNPTEDLDRAVRAGIAKLTGGLAPTALASAYFDWAVHLAASPGKRFELAARAILAALENGQFAARCANGAADPCHCALPQDNRFRAAEWQKFPFNVYAHSFLSIERWWDLATTGVRGVSAQHENVVAFAARQILDTMAPSNFLVSNPTALDRTVTTRGANLVHGFSNLAEDLLRAATGQDGGGESTTFTVGKSVAATPGKVVLRTRLAEIIQYAPATDRVRPEPIVIVPAWIMKYYILDLSPVNSMVKYLTQQGFTVFMISWKNPVAEDRNAGFDDYRIQGVLPALEAATVITGASSVHAVGYCLGGTLLAITAAAMARDHDDRLATLTFLAAQVDFTEAGELMLFINESQVAFLEDMMWERGYLDARQMAGAFQLLRSNDLIWSRMVQDYLLGKRSVPIDIMGWNADATRMPYRMHSEYLRSLFLDNDLAEGRFKVDDRPITVHDICTPIFAVGTEWDHVAPWRSVFKLHLLTDSEVTFVLTNGGHNAGVLSEPGHENRHFRISCQRHGDRYVDPETWLATNTPRNGSWWPAWASSLAARSGEPVAVPRLGQAGGRFAPLEDAPGRYVFMK